jgi:hypothetical protein
MLALGPLAFKGQHAPVIKVGHILNQQQFYVYK